MAISGYNGKNLWSDVRAQLDNMKEIAEGHGPDEGPKEALKWLHAWKREDKANFDKELKKAEEAIKYWIERTVRIRELIRESEAAAAEVEEYCEELSKKRKRTTKKSVPKKRK